MLDVRSILELIPHRYPFLLVDRVLELEAGKRIVGIKNVTMNEPFFQGHFPGRPIMPGVLIAEAMAQAGGIMILSMPEARGKLAVLAGIEKIRFRRPVFPGDQLRLEAEALKIRSRVGTFNARALVDGQVAAEGEFIYSVVDAIE